MTAHEPGKWRARRIERRLANVLPWRMGPLRPVEIIGRLEYTLLDRTAMVEDANYYKYTPNHFIVEINDDNFRQNYQPILGRVAQQWQEQLAQHLATANSRQGRLTYRLGGPLRVEIQPSEQLKPHEARILYRLAADLGGPRRLPACLERIEDRHCWPLHEGVLSLGRDSSNDIALDTPAVQSARLVSSYHAHLVCEPGSIRLFDGDPGGAPSVNGTYVNHRRVPSAGHVLQDGDIIILAALQPGRPRPDTPGVAVLRFVNNCSEGAA